MPGETAGTSATGPGGYYFGGTAGAMTAGYIMFEELYNRIL